MARIGIKSLTWGVFSSGGAGSACVYTSPKMETGLMRRADITIEREDVSQYGDNTRQEHANGATGTDIKLELTRADETIREKLLGYAPGASQSHELSVTEDEAPYVGFGYITCEVANGVKSYVGYWHYKVQFGMDTDSAETKGENTSFQNVNLSGKGMAVQLAAAGKMTFYTTKEASDEATIVAWLKSLAGIT